MAGKEKGNVPALQRLADTAYSIVCSVQEGAAAATGESTVMEEAEAMMAGRVAGSTCSAGLPT